MWYDKVTYPELRKLAQEAYDDWQPDTVLIEKKASGQSLLQDLRMGGIPVLSLFTR
jgi:phage terminase large subunit-like protein